MTNEQHAPRGRVKVEPSAKRVRAYVHGVAIADTTHALLVWEVPYYPAYYVPVADVRMDLLVPTDTVTHSPSRGDARHFTVKVDDVERKDAAWQYTDSPFEELRDAIRFDWHAMDAWFEEDEEVIVHPRSPYTRASTSCRPRATYKSSSTVSYSPTRRTRVLFETGLPPRWYIPKVDVRMELLEPTDSTSQCPYKGTAEYWSVRIGDRLEKDLAWSYPTALPESERIIGLVSFYNERVDLVIDGERTERPHTKFSSKFS